MLKSLKRLFLREPVAKPLEAEITMLADDLRERYGRDRLEPDPLLVLAARNHSRAMAEQQFFSHTSPIAGLRTPAERVRVEGAHYDAIGENIAMHPRSNAAAGAFVDGWMKSPGHRDNLLKADWETTGVGVFETPDGTVFATQLFGIPARLTLDAPEIDARADEWRIFRVEMRIGRDHSLAAFVRNRFVTSADADARGRVQLDFEIPSEPGRCHVGFGRRRAGSTSGWIGVHEGTAEIRSSGRDIWHAGAPHQASGCEVMAENLYRVKGTTLRLTFRGETLEPAICVVDGEVYRSLAPGAFQVDCSFRAGTGVRDVSLGFPEDGTSFQVARRFQVDTEKGRLTEC